MGIIVGTYGDKKLSNVGVHTAENFAEKESDEETL